MTRAPVSREGFAPSAAQKLVTPNGEELVLMPRAEYEALLDALDIAEARLVQADVAAGRDEAIPAEMVYRLMDGENPILVWREYRGLTGVDLAAKAGTSAASLSKLETGKTAGDIATLKKLARALSVDLDELVP